jgi:hypothetical protein
MGATVENPVGALGWVVSPWNRARGWACAGLGLAALALPPPRPALAQSTAAAASEESSPGPVDPNSTLTCSVYDAPFTDALPIIGHHYQDTLVLAPGTSDLDGDGNPVVHGSRDTAVRFTLDAGDTGDPAAGGFGQNLGPLAIESVRLVTAGAPAEYGRAMGGFAEITSPSGGNDFAGRLWILWRGSFLDGDGADNEDFLPFEEPALEWNDLRVAASAGGALVRDQLWYFATIESIDSEQPTASVGPDTLIESHGYCGLGKLTWQASPENRLDLQVSADPLEVSGLGITPFSTPDSGFDQDQQGVATQLRWTGIFSEDLALDAGFMHFDSDLTIAPTSDAFGPLELEFTEGPFGASATYPCLSFNCRLDDDISRIDPFGQISGPYPFLINRETTRDLLRAALTIDIHDRLGDHRLSMGFEAGTEEMHEEQATNLILLDLTQPFLGTGGPVNPFAVSGVQIVQTPIPSHLDGTVSNFVAGGWLSDAWKIRPGLSINAGIRYDADSLDAPGYRAFDPRAERRTSIGLWESVCAEARRQGVVFPSSNCFLAQNYDGNPPSGVSNSMRSSLDADMNGVNDVPEEVAALDLNRNGFLELEGFEAIALYQHFTTGDDRHAERFVIEDANVSPRLGVSWDPWSDGRTRAFAHWGRYHDRLLLETALVESGPDALNFTFVPNALTHLIGPGTPSTGSVLPSISQVDHELKTPHTDEWSLGFERELGAAWSVGLTFVNRSAEDLLYDRDVNHYTCAQAGGAIGIDPNAICGDGGELDPDEFGSVVFVGPGFLAIPNGLEDLYAANPAFNQVHSVTNTSASDYTAWELEFVRALHRGWQLQMSYTLSRARGEIATIVDGDPSLSGAETASLDFDQRHAFKLQAAVRLPRGVVLGGIVSWVSGTPYSIFETTADLDSEANAQTRTILPTGGLNDQRNNSALRLDGRLEKSFAMGGVTAGGFLLVENLLNDDDLVIESAAPGAATLIAERDFGRRFEIGALFSF